MKDKQETKPQEKSIYKDAFPYLVASLATFAILCKNPYRATLLMYPSTGGGGLNVFKRLGNSDFKRVFGLDYHPLWNPNTKQKEWTLHYHRGATIKEMKKHRPYQGGW